MIARGADAFRAAVDGYDLGAVCLDAELERACAAVGDAPLVLLGEAHGVRETPSLLYALAGRLGARAVAFEWSHEELDDVVQRLVADGELELDPLWALPPAAELFCGDGRITAGHFALLRALRAKGRLAQAILYDRLDREPPHPPEVRDAEMAARLLEQWNGRDRVLALTGAGHAMLEGETMAVHLRRAVPGLAVGMIAYAEGRCRSRGEHDVSGPMPPAPIAFQLPLATPAVVPGAT